MALLLVSSVGFARINAQYPTVDCVEYGINAANAEEDHYGLMSTSEWLHVAADYVAACNDAGGNIDDPVFL